MKVEGLIKEEGGRMNEGLKDASLRILLWDIDGTLIRSVRSGAFKDYTIPMLEEVFGTAGRYRR